jgi:hypothetical protein
MSGRSTDQEKGIKCTLLFESKLHCLLVWCVVYTCTASVSVLLSLLAWLCLVSAAAVRACLQLWYHSQQGESISGVALRNHVPPDTASQTAHIE